MTTPLSDPTNVQFELVDDEPGFTEAEVVAFLVGADTSTFEVPKITIAAADVHTGAMIALVPTEEDARRLALDGFEEPDQLHVTFVYLGDAADFDEHERGEIVDVVRRHATEPVTARAFSVNIFNPDQEETALVLGVGNAGGSELEAMRTGIFNEVRADHDIADNHSPWVPHLTLAYSEHPHELLQQAIDRVGPVTFDRVRVAFGGENTDVPLGTLTASWQEFHLPGKHNQQDHNPHKGYRVVSEVKLQRRLAALDATLGKYYKSHSTNFTERDKYGVWKPERDAIHRQIADELYKKAAGVPAEGRAIFLGGNAGAGKSTVITKQAGVDLNNYFKIDPDDIKEELAKRGLVPKLPEGDFAPMEVSTLVHNEAVRIGDMLADRAFRERKNVIWDGTMGNPGLIRSRVKKMDDLGYSKISAVFVDVSDDTSQRRVKERYRQGLYEWQQGKGQGARYVPKVIQKSLSSAQSRSNFNYLRKSGMFDTYAVYSNDVDGQPAKLLDKVGEV